MTNQNDKKKKIPKKEKGYGVHKRQTEKLFLD